MPGRRRLALTIAAVGVLAAAAGCDDGLVCGRGTHREGAACVADGRDGDVGGEDASTGGMDAATDAAAADAGGSDAGAPVFPDVIDHLTLAIRTGAGPNDGTDANAISLCLSATRCFALNVADVNDFRRGEIDVYHFDGIALPRSEVDRVELRSSGGTDAWRPSCVEMRWDGEPVHCADALSTLFGSAGGAEVESWSDPDGVHAGCTTCYPDTITHGPLVGEVTPSSARVLVRSDATRRVALRLADESRPGELPVVGVRHPHPDDDYTAIFEIGALAPERQYQVLVEVDGVLGPARASFRTPPADGAPMRQRIAFGSCARADAQPIFGTIRAMRPDLFLFVGDNHYANSPDLESLWWFYRRALEIPERASLLASVPTLAIWDDHDFVGNNTNRTSPGRASALRAFGDYWADPPTGLPAEPGVYFRARWGDVDLFMLDDRYERDVPGTAGGHIVGDEQAAWLERELSASSATFKVIASGTIFSPTGDESWLDYPSSRDRLFDFIRDEGITGVVLISGDVHRSQLRRIHRTAAGGYDLPEVVSSPLANSNSTCPASVEPDAAQIACHDTGTSFAVLDVDTTLADPRIVARILDGAGLELSSMEIRRSDLE